MNYFKNHCFGFCKILKYNSWLTYNNHMDRFPIENMHNVQKCSSDGEEDSVLVFCLMSVYSVSGTI